MNQYHLLPNSKRSKIKTKKALVERRKYYGGSLNYRKVKRPLNTNKAIHLTMRSDVCTKGVSLRKHTAGINKYIFKFSERFGVRVYKHSINSNHVHLVMRVKDRGQYIEFIRALSGAIALKMKLQYKIAQQFWQERPFTRLVSWGRDFQTVCKYIMKNFKETVGFVDYTPRMNRYTVIDRLAEKCNST